MIGTSIFTEDALLHLKFNGKFVGRFTGDRSDSMISSISGQSSTRKGSVEKIDEVALLIPVAAEVSSK